MVHFHYNLTLRLRSVVYSLFLELMNLSKLEDLAHLRCRRRMTDDGPIKADVEKDLIGNPDNLSNIRPILRRSNPKTPLDAQLKTEQNQVESWNQEFWKNHNKRFYAEKSKFIQDLKSDGIEEISADKMSEFYKSFLDKNRERHLVYNWEWYKKNGKLLYLAFLVQLEKAFSRYK